MRHRILFALAALLMPISLWASPASYQLQPDTSSVEFTYQLSGQSGSGTMPILKADLKLDFEAAANSSAVVELDAANAKTGVIFVTQALKGPTILNTDAHPRILFRSRDFKTRSGGATVSGDVTIRGVTKPLTLEADIFRRQGSPKGDHRNLTVVLTGRLNRSDFTASGYPGLVDDVVTLRILARIKRRE